MSTWEWQWLPCPANSSAKQDRLGGLYEPLDSSSGSRSLGKSWMHGHKVDLFPVVPVITGPNVARRARAGGDTGTWSSAPRTAKHRPTHDVGRSQRGGCLEGGGSQSGLVRSERRLPSDSPSRRLHQANVIAASTGSGIGDNAETCGTAARGQVPAQHDTGLRRHGLRCPATVFHRSRSQWFVLTTRVMRRFRPRPSRPPVLRATDSSGHRSFGISGPSGSKVLRDQRERRIHRARLPGFDALRRGRSGDTVAAPGSEANRYGPSLT
jgi:hypothetical protein